MKLTLKAPAKINLLLSVKGRMPNGYHEIESIMQTVTLFDEVAVTRCDTCGGQNIDVTCTNPDIPCDGRNLVTKCAKAYFEAAGIRDYKIKIHIEKSIPMAAGLAGGSTDGAAVLILLNRLYGELCFEELCRVGGGIGADIPFCIKGGTQIARGIGEILTDCPTMPDCIMVIACGGEGVSTPWAYSLVDAAEHTDCIEASCMAEIIRQGDINEISSVMYNSFEGAILPHRPVACRIRDIMNDGGAIRAMMSGSGPSVVGIFDSEDAARTVCDKIQNEGYFSSVCRPYFGTDLISE